MRWVWAAAVSREEGSRLSARRRREGGERPLASKERTSSWREEEGEEGGRRGGKDGRGFGFVSQDERREGEESTFAFREQRNSCSTIK